jgi:hypothetical protein
MKPRLIALLASLFLLALGYIAYAYRYPLAAKIWHWRHGYSASMGNYVVPVPEHWLVLDENSVAFTLMNTSPKRHQRDGKLHTTAVIDVFPFRDRIIDADKMLFWVSLQKQRLASEQAESVEEKTMKFGDESITCIGGPELNAVLGKKPNHPRTDAVSLNCMSEHGFNVLFVGELSDIQPFYNFLSQIRRKD